MKEALQNGIYTQNEINESGIEPFPMDSMDINDNNEQIKGNMPIQNGVQVPNRRLKTGNCECCSIF